MPCRRWWDPGPSAGGRPAARRPIGATRGLGKGTWSGGDGNATGLGRLGLGELHLEDTVHQACGDVLAVEVLRVGERESARVVADVVLGVGGREPLVVLEGD